MSTTLSMERTGRITGSRISGVLGLSPYWTKDEVMRDMVRGYFWDDEEFTGNFITDWGKEHEPEAVDEYEMTHGVRVLRRGDDQETRVHPVWDFLAGTPDGLIGTEGSLEVKCPWKAPYTHISQRQDYEAQIRLVMEVFDLEWGDFGVWRPDGALFSRLDRSDFWFAGTPNERCWDEVLEELAEFNDEFAKTIADPELYQRHREPLVDIRTDMEWMLAAAEALEWRFAGEAANRGLEIAKQRLIELANDKTSKGGGVHLVRGKSEGGGGSVSYKKALDHYAPGADLKPFTGPPKAPGQPSWTLRRITEK